MRRLIYAPRAFAFISSSTLGQIVDVSDDIVSGWVDRSDNDMSKAELVLRNVNRKYVRTADGKQVFSWDDLITIWLQRMPGQPVQVFTGYLDSVPGWQMYPGDCRIEATCTLKRLAHSWFDPGSSFFTNLATSRGWVYNPATGQGYSSQLYPSDPNDPDSPAPIDSGMSGFLFEFLTQVANWDPSMVMVGELNPNLIDQAAKMQQDRQEALDDRKSQFAEAMRRFIGMDAIDALAEGGVNPDGSVTAEITRRVKAIQKAIGTTDVPLQFFVFAALARSQMEPQYSEGSAAGPDLHGYGLFRLQPGAAPDAHDTRMASYDSVDPSSDDEELIDGKPASAYVGNVALSVNLFKRKLSVALHHVLANDPTARKGALSKLETNSQFAGLILNEMGLGVSPETTNSAFDNADRYVRAVIGGEAVAPPETGEVGRETVVLNWDSEELMERLTPEEQKVVAKYSSHHRSLVPYLYWAKTRMGEEVELIYPPGVRKESLYLKGSVRFDPDEGGSGEWSGSLHSLFKRFEGHDEVTSVTLAGTGVDRQLYLREGEPGLNSSGDPGAPMLANNSIRIVMDDPEAEPADWLELPTEVDTADNAASAAISRAGAGFKFSQLGQFTTIAALQSQYAFEAIDGLAGSLLLQGNQALMNDVSCLDATKQFAQGSLRNLMSLPNGRLCAYYPDYFGARRGPYWYIREIEIINMGIQLTDGPLATHVYVTGDTVSPSATGGAIDFVDRLQSDGVVSVFDVELLNAFLVPGVLTEGKKDRRKRELNFDSSQAQDFLNRHGMRPLKEENPIIKNPWYEFLMAWQRFMQQWASCYDTRVEFTFQPEVMAGGILGFSEHGLQMYCKQVRHDFSYESGFATSATLTSPAAIYNPADPNRTDPGSLPGMVIAGGINTVGGGA